MPIDWTYEEIVLVCDIVVANGWRALDRRRDPRVLELSELIRRMSPVRAAADPTFRNADGVGRKSFDVATAHPDNPSKKTKGGGTTETVVEAFIDRPEQMRSLAAAVRAAARAPGPPAFAGLIDLDVTAEEGALLERTHLDRERDPRSRRDKIKEARGDHGVVRCEACQFDFEATYGPRGRDFIEVHHRAALSVTGPRLTRLRDLALLCSNCHRMIHRSRPWLSVEQLLQLVKQYQ